MSNIILIIMLVFSVLGGLDRLLGNKYGLGERFEEGFKSMGGLAMSMVGIISLAPVISQLVMPLLSPVANLIGADPSIFISSILATDMGGYATSAEIAGSGEMAQYAGLILSSMMGTTLSFTIPIALNLVSQDDLGFFTKGVLAGIITIPVGMVVGGIYMGIPVGDIWINLLPVILLSLAISLGLFKFQDYIMKVFNILGKIIITISFLGLLLSILDFVLGIKLMASMASFEEGIVIVGGIAIILSGAYPLFFIIWEKSSDKLDIISERLDINEFAVLGLLSSLANCVPMLALYDKMDSRGKTINAAFGVSGAFVFGGQLGYVAGINHDMVGPFILAKLSAGLAAILLANLLVDLEESRKKFNLEKPLKES